MNITEMIEELREEREGVKQAILVLERIATGRSKPWPSAEVDDGDRATGKAEGEEEGLTS